MATDKGLVVSINRAPVLALWATVVAERLGFSREEALSLGKAVTGLNAQAKGRHLGIYKKHEMPGERREGWADSVELFGREVPVTRTAEGVRALSKGEPVPARSAQAYLESKFGEHLAAVRAAMEELAKSMKPDVLAARAFAFYAQFRPQIPDGVKGWGAKGELDTDLIRSLAGPRK
ncbi:hypothetical protein FJY68_01935 [candidate division WOR-3 bacterium]|uniref:Uncharacterized protein n=1 Tax=candidate division WOR-3 bacterium TaxID=2052148 RepID=A0A938BNX4_UNCW3|nr:hypothetical protein [candidate division WOR-3 bacterium]